MLALDGKIKVRCTRQQAWELFCRFGEVAALIPSVKEVQVDGDTVHARMETKLGALPVSSRVTLEVVERVPLSRLRAEGWSYLGETITEQVKQLEGIKRESAGRLELQLDLQDGDEPGIIELCYAGRVDAKGRLKRIYQAILKSKAPEMLEQFAQNLRAALEQQPTPAPAPLMGQPAPPPAARPEQAAGAAALSPEPPAAARHPGDQAAPAGLLRSLLELLQQLWQRLLAWIRSLIHPAARAT